MEKKENRAANDQRAGEERRKVNDLGFNGADRRAAPERRTKKKKTVFVRCYNCLMLNRVPEERLSRKPACGNCKTVLEFPWQPEWAKLESFDRTVAHWPETLLVVFTAPMCLYCKIIDPIVHDLAREKAGQLRILKVDIESEGYLAQRFKIAKTPTFVVYKAGIEVLRIDGAPKEKTDVVTWINNLINYTSY